MPFDDTQSYALHERLEEPELVEIGTADVDFHWRLDASLAQRASAIRGDAVAESSAAVGGEIALSVDECDLLRVGGQLDGTLRRDDPFAAQQWASVCPLAGELTMQLEHLLEWDVRPRLLAKPRLQPEAASRRETFSVSIDPRSMRMNEPGPLTLLPDPPAEYMTYGETTMTISMGWTAGADDVLPTVTADMMFVGYLRERDDDVPLDVDFVGMEMLGAFVDDDGNRDPDDDGMVMAARLDLVRWSGVYWRGLRLSGRYGVGLVDADVGVLEPHHDTHVTVSEPALAVERDLDDEVTLRAAAERSHWAMWNGLAVIDDRLTLGFSRDGERLRLRAEGFAAQSYLIDGDDDITTAITGGGSAVAEADLGDHAVVRVRSDFGRGFYAAGATLDEPRWAGEILATVDLHAGTR